MPVLFAKILAFALLAMSSSRTDATLEWQLKKSEQGIKVYTREVADSDLDAFKGVCTLDATMSDILNILEKPDDFCSWMPRCSKSNLVIKEGDDLYYYFESEAPFPLDNRDCYYHYQFEKKPKSTRVKVTGLPEYGPKKDGVVRIPMVKGFWLLEDLGNQKTRITYQLQAHPGGSIPTWLANAGSVDLPFDTLFNLGKKVQS